VSVIDNRMERTTSLRSRRQGRWCLFIRALYTCCVSATSHRRQMKRCFLEGSVQESRYSTKGKGNSIRCATPNARCVPLSSVLCPIYTKQPLLEVSILKDFTGESVTPLSSNSPEQFFGLRDGRHIGCPLLEFSGRSGPLDGFQP